VANITEKSGKVGKGRPPEHTKWKKGAPSPNPDGKPKGLMSAKTIVKRWLEAKEKAENPITGDSESLSQLDLITLAQLVKAKKGDTIAFSALLDRLEGKPKQVTEEIGKGVVINVLRPDE
jgi:hypothetical protein